MNRYLVKPNQKAIGSYKEFQFNAQDENEARRFWCVKNGISGHANSGFCNVELLESDVVPSLSGEKTVTVTLPVEVANLMNEVLNRWQNGRRDKFTDEAMRETHVIDEGIRLLKQELKPFTKAGNIGGRVS